MVNILAVKRNILVNIACNFIIDHEVSYFLLPAFFRYSQVCYNLLLLGISVPLSQRHNFTSPFSVQLGQLLCFTDHFSAQSSL